MKINYPLYLEGDPEPPPLMDAHVQAYCLDKELKDALMRFLGRAIADSWRMELDRPIGRRMKRPQRWTWRNRIESLILKLTGDTKP